MRKISRISIILAAALAVILSASACDCGGSGNFGKDPAAEYARVYGLAADGAVFDFDEHPTFSVVASGSLSGENVTEPISFSSRYSHDYRTEKVKTYSYSKNVNSVTMNYAGKPEAYYDEIEQGWQFCAETNYDCYQDSRLDYNETDGSSSWSKPMANGSEYAGVFYEEWAQRAHDRLVRGAEKLFDPEKLENFDGAKSGGMYVASASVKAGFEKDFVAWIDAFFPLFYLRNVNEGREWKFFDLESGNLSGALQIKTSAQMLDEIAVTFTCNGAEGTGLGLFTFSARAAFKSGGVSVPDLTFYTQGK